jgi:hypothetical protein
MPFKSHDEYFAAQAEDLRGRLELIQQEVERQVPGSTRTIRYNLPAFRKDKTFFYFAAFRKHIGIYPPVTEDADLIRETALLRGPKGNLSSAMTPNFQLNSSAGLPRRWRHSTAATRGSRDHRDGITCAKTAHRRTVPCLLPHKPPHTSP